VTLIADRAGASELFSGALDLEPWEVARDLALDAEVRDFADALGTWSVTDDWRLVATRAGVVRPARGIDSSLLDLQPLAGRRVAVADTGRPGFDGVLTARALAASRWGEATGARFDAVRVDVMKDAGERFFGDFDFAHLHDDPARLAWLERLAKKHPVCLSTRHEAVRRGSKASNPGSA
jgi:hypothetical protein